jgi:hypothetical protein
MVDALLALILYAATDKIASRYNVSSSNSWKLFRSFNYTLPWETNFFLFLIANENNVWLNVTPNAWLTNAKI